MFLAVLHACHSPETPTTTVILAAELRKSLDAEVLRALAPKAEEEVRTTTVPLPLGGSLRADWTINRTHATGHYVTSIGLVVLDAEGSMVDAEIHGEPVNLGTGTGPQVRMMQAALVSQRRDRFGGQSSAQVLIEFRCDGEPVVR